MPLTEAQREIRKKGVTGSEIATLVGLNAYRSPQELWEEKLGMRERDLSLDDNPNIERGVFLEPALLAWTEKRVGYTVTPNSETFVSEKNPLIIATPDGFGFPGQNFQGRQVVEVKAPGPRSYENWGDPEEVPDSIDVAYIPQVQWEMAATDAQDAIVSTLIGGQLRVYRMQRSQPLIDTLTKRAEAFWACVEHQDPPPLDFTRSVERDWLKKHLANQKSDEMREYGSAEAESIEDDIQKFLAAKLELDAAEEKLAQVKSFLQFFVGDAAGFTTPGYKVTWKQAKGSWKTDWKRFLATLNKALPQHVDLFERTLKDCDYESSGSRRFLVSPKKEK
jgi:putative phage-type endonuclease